MKRLRIVSIMLMMLLLIFIDHTEAAEVKKWESPTLVSEQKDWVITLSQKIDTTTVSPLSVFVENSKGIKQDVSFEVINEKQIKVFAPKEHYVLGENYNLFVLNLKSAQGQALDYDYLFNFSIDATNATVRALPMSKTASPASNVKLTYNTNASVKDVHWTTTSGSIIEQDGETFWVAPEDYEENIELSVTIQTNSGQILTDSETVTVTPPVYQSIDLEKPVTDEHDRETDTDLDGLSDYDELNIYFTNPMSTDSDYDGIPDGEEVQNGTDPNEDTSRSVLATTDLKPLKNNYKRFNIAEDSLAFRNQYGFGYYTNEAGGMCMGLAMFSMLYSLDVLPISVITKNTNIDTLKEHGNKSKILKELEEKQWLYNFSDYNNVLAKDIPQDHLERTISYLWAEGNKMDEEEEGYFVERDRYNRFFNQKNTNYIHSKDLNYIINLLEAGLPTVITVGYEKGYFSKFSGHAVTAYAYKQITADKYHVYVYDNNGPYASNEELYQNNGVYIEFTRKPSVHNQWDYSLSSWNVIDTKKNADFRQRFSYFKTDEYLYDIENNLSMHTTNPIISGNTITFETSKALTQAQLDGIRINKARQNSDATAKRLAPDEVMVRSVMQKDGLVIITLPFTPTVGEQYFISYPTWIEDGLPSAHDTTMLVSVSDQASVSGKWQVTLGGLSTRYGYLSGGILDLTEHSDGTITGQSYLLANDKRYPLNISGKRTGNSIYLEELWTNFDLLTEAHGTHPTVAKNLIAYKPYITFEGELTNGKIVGENIYFGWQYNKYTYEITRFIPRYNKSTLLLTPILDNYSFNTQNRNLFSLPTNTRFIEVDEDTVEASISN